MKQLILITAMLISIAAFGQDTLNQKTTATGFKRFLFGVTLSPDYCYRTLKNNDGSSWSSIIIDLRDEKEVPKFGYTAGLNICYNISKHTVIEAGVHYSNKGYALKNTDLTYGLIIDPRLGFTYPVNGTLPTEAQFIYNHRYLDLPLRAIFSFGENRMHFIASAGVTTNILLKATQTSILGYANGDVTKETKEELNDYKSINISPSISAGIDYGISNKINLRVEPTFRYGLLKIIDTPVTAYLWNGGINITCYYVLY